MSETNTVSPLRQHMIEDMAARKLNPHTQRSHIQSCKRFAFRILATTSQRSGVAPPGFEPSRGFAQEAAPAIVGFAMHRKDSQSLVRPNAALSQRCWLLPIVGLPNIGRISQRTAGTTPWTALVRSDPIQPDSFLAGCVMSSLFSQRRSMHVVNGARVHELRSNDEGRSDG